MKKKIFALLTALCMTAAVLPAVFADGEEEPIECSCTTQCTEESKNEACPVCGGEDADLSQCTGIPPMTAGTQEQCSCVVLCTEDNKNPDCPVCSAEGADLSACKGEPVQPVLFGAPRAVEVEINEINFPDQTFRNYVKNFDADNDNTLSAAEIEKVDKIDVSYQGISDLTGIEHFTALITLNCNSNNLTSLDVHSNTKLTTLDCSSNQLTELDVSKNTKLTRLYCSDNQLTELDVSENKELTILNCDNNQLMELDVSQNEALDWLYCSNNNLTELDVSNNTNLIVLDCSGQTREIPVSQGADGSWSLDLSTLVDDWNRVSDITATGATLNDSTVSWTDGSVQPVVTYNYDVEYKFAPGEKMDVTLTLIPPQPTDPTTPETTAPTDTDHTVQTDNSGHAPVEDNTALPSFWELVTERINATPRGGEITINMGARAVPDSVLNALRARSLTATFRYGDTELTLTPDRLPPEGTLTEWTLRELGNYVAEADESIRISVEKSEAENAATIAETTAPAADTGKPNPATGETTTTAAAMLIAAAALTGLGVTLKRK